MMLNDLEHLYRGAKSALRDRDYDRASELLRQILLVDENYKDASRLLAQAVKLRRRRWYSDVRVWSALAALALVGAVIFLRPALRSRYANQAPAPSARPTIAASATAQEPPATATAAPVPLAWKRLSVGQQFQRDLITSIVFDPQDPEVIYAGSERAGVYKSIDGGLSWQPAQNGIERAAVDTLAIDPERPQTLYAGIRLGGLYKTTDGGQNWQRVEGGFNLNVKDIASIVLVDPRNTAHVIYSPAFSIYDSIDGGRTWIKKRMSRCPEVIGALMMDPANSQNLFAIDVGGQCNYNGLYVSHDGGSEWSPVIAGEEISDPGLATDPTGRYMYAGAAEWLVASSDGGRTWQQFKPECNGQSFLALAGGTALCAGGSAVVEFSQDGKNSRNLGDTQQGWTRVLAVRPGMPSTILAGGNGIATSRDGGATWESTSNGLPASRLQLKLPPGDDPNLYAEQNGCMAPYASPDGGTSWIQLWEQYAGCQLEFDAGGLTRYLMSQRPSGDTEILRSIDRGSTWSSIVWPVGARSVEAVLPHPQRAGTVYWLPRQGAEPPYVSTDSGDSWHRVPSEGSLWAVRFFAGPASIGRAYAISPSLLAPDRSDDGGLSWTPCLSNADTTINVSDSNTRAVVDPRNSDRLMVATQGGGVVMSEDGCKSWRPVNSGLGNLYVNSVALDPFNPDTVYVGTDGGAYISFDGAQHWQQINDGLLGATVVYSIVVGRDGSVYAATPYGIFRLEERR